MDNSGSKATMMDEDFSTKATSLVLKTYFPQVAETTLREVLGESGSSATIYYLGPEALRDPKVFDSRLREIFGPGAEPILQHLLRNMESSKNK